MRSDALAHSLATVSRTSGLEESLDELVRVVIPIDTGNGTQRRDGFVCHVVQQVPREQRVGGYVVHEPVPDEVARIAPGPGDWR